MVEANEGHKDIPRHDGGRIYRLSTLRFIPRGDKVPKVLIHLLSRTLRSHASWLRASSITMTDMSDSACVLLLKCATTGDSSVLRCVISYRWPFTLIWSGWLVSPTYRRPHLLHVIKYTCITLVFQSYDWRTHQWPSVLDMFCIKEPRMGGCQVTRMT